MIEGRPPYPAGDEPSTNYYSVSPGYFKAIGIPLLRGRLITERDTKDTTRVVIINETMAKRFFPGEDPIGKRVHVTMGPVLYREIVGIVGDVKHDSLDEQTGPQTTAFFRHDADRAHGGRSGAA
jgi:putative ABC transport system permease protein